MAFLETACCWMITPVTWGAFASNQSSKCITRARRCIQATRSSSRTCSPANSSASARLSPKSSKRWSQSQSSVAGGGSLLSLPSRFAFFAHGKTDRVRMRLSVGCHALSSTRRAIATSAVAWANQTPSSCLLVLHRHPPPSSKSFTRTIMSVRFANGTELSAFSTLRRATSSL